MRFLSIGRHWQYAAYVWRHKWFVFLAGWRLGIPWLALLHDNSKFRPDEWGPYAAHFYNPDGSKQTFRASDGFFSDLVIVDVTFERAWLKHIARNKHHPQHYIRVKHAPCRISDHSQFLFEDDGMVKCLDCVIKGYDWVFERNVADFLVEEMPCRYRQEMLADWIGAGMAQGTPDTLGWYSARGRHHVFGLETRAWIEQQLGVGQAAEQPEVR